MIRVDLGIWGRYHKGEVLSSHHIRGHMIVARVFTGGVHFDHLVKVESARFLTVSYYFVVVFLYSTC